MSKIASKRQWILLLCWLAYSTVYLGRGNLAIAAPIMEQEKLLSAVQIGALGSCFFATYALGQIVNGYLGDRVNPKRMFLGGFFIAAVCNILMGFTEFIPFMFILWSINGYTQSMIWGPILKIIASNFKEEKARSKAAIILSTSVGVGGILAIIIPTMVLGNGVKTIFFVPGIIMLIIGICNGIFIPRSDLSNDGAQVRQQHIPYLKLFSNKEVRNMLMPTLAHGIIKDNLSLWTPLLLVQMYQVNVKQLAVYAFLIPLATLIGRVIFVYVYRWLHEDEKSVVGVSFGICVVVLLPMIIFETPLWLTTILLTTTSLAISLINASLLTMFPLHFAKSNNIASVSGVMDFVTYVGAALGSALFGVFIEGLGYQAMLGLWMVLCIISIAIIGHKFIISQDKVSM